MATITILIEEAEDDLLPAVCALTGEPTKDRTEQRFTWVPLPLYILSMVIPYGRLVRRLSQKEMSVILPLQERHHWHWLWRGLVWVGALLAGIGGLVVGGLIANTQPPVGYAVMAAGGLAVLTSIVLRVVFIRTSIHAVEMTDRSVTLANVHPEFVAAVRDERDRREREELEDEEREWERRQRRRDRDRERSHDDDDARPRRAWRVDDRD